ncbi:reverse transcriptase [Gossypium australe]|uniref:Reverse transcriptase n=1 Tax=Gossypium australe TaxID=47621 RepID=A0A5B6WX70_9ROSI|nr:reverse transcriptase [Gossypium australe]
MAVKLDMSKAYDRVDNDAYGFFKGLGGINFEMYYHSFLSVNINGKRGRVFQATRGLRQGEPLSHFIFLLCSEGFSALMRLAVKEDDCILFGEATNKGARLLKRILKEYEECYGQCVNFNKSTIFYSSNTSKGNKGEISAILGVRSSTDMEKYLGLPNVVGRQKVHFRIKDWSNIFLSQGGKEVFIKLVLQAIPTYAMSCFLLPNSLYGELERIIANFWWQKAHGKKGIQWCQW